MQVSILNLVGLWWSGKLHNTDYLMWFIPTGNDTLGPLTIAGLGRIGVALQILGTLFVVFDIAGSERIRDWGRSMNHWIEAFHLFFNKILDSGNQDKEIPFSLRLTVSKLRDYFKIILTLFLVVSSFTFLTGHYSVLTKNGLGQFVQDALGNTLVFYLGANFFCVAYFVFVLFFNIVFIRNIANFLDKPAAEGILKGVGSFFIFIGFIFILLVTN